MATAPIDGLPDNALFQRLLFVANHRRAALIHDIINGVHASYYQLLQDVVNYRQRLREVLPQSLLTDTGILREDDVYICTTTRASYEMIVAFFAILSIGAAIVPLSPTLMPEEAVDLYQRYSAKCILTHLDAAQLAGDIEQYAQSRGIPKPIVLSVCLSTPSDVSGGRQPFIDPNITLPIDRPVIVLSSSGTTGPPKGIIHALRYFTAQVGPLGSEDTLVLAHRPMHYGASLSSAITSILRGIRLEIVCPGSGAHVIWERLRQGGVTNLAGSVGFWVSLMEHFQQHLANLPAQELQPYLDGARGLRVANCSGAMAMPSIKTFWKEIRRRPLQVVWGSSESSIGLKTSSEVDTTYLNAIGRPVPGVTVKLSEGDHGEMRVKTPTMFLRYWGNESATQAAFDEEGFYKTGDLVYLHGKDYIIQGRASTDIINCNSAKIYILTVETALSTLPYISEAYVLPVADPKTGSRVAALVRCRTGQKPKLTLQSLRNDLSSPLPVFQLPTVLRILGEGEEVPRTVSGKVIRGAAKELFFPQKADPSLDDLPSQVQVCDFRLDTDLRPRRMWDKGGVQ
ncbi:class I adenylate-forming enzyme family protein [Aspergillus alliaceus]|uniref:class I adenylate-forming enzyme family protein n=1 Tax=Petromyces alliaceus TaxID=209559 RepID=UPI0012A57798|nr:uncharacterized protein BDW43DRAFT_324187 [Aspergillus alliaceus]KAB8227114.1 hypothetical protein BDW43DRAFT_324187 [Aspergillus alliaceus]